MVKDDSMFISPIYNEKGFTLLELAMVMVIIGLLAGGGVSLMGMLSERKMRNEASEYLNDAKNSLINFAKIHGRLPWADSDWDGDQDTGASVGTFPYLDLSFKPSDSYNRVLVYELNSNLGSSLPNSCSALRTGLSASSPLVVDSDGSTSAFSVAAVLVSAGPKNADNAGPGNLAVFDAVNSGGYSGDNTDGIPNYIRFPPNDTFDDLLVYISGYELYGEICGDHPELTVINSSTTNDVFVYNTTQSIDIGKIEKGVTKYYPVISGEKFELWTAAGQSGSLVTSEFIVSGSGVVLDVSP